MEKIEGYRIYDKLIDVYNTPSELLREGCKCYCVETKTEYRWLNERWDVIETDIPKQIQDKLNFGNNLKIEKNSIQFLRKNGTKALELILDENEEGNIVFYDKKGKAIGIFNPVIFE